MPKADITMVPCPTKSSNVKEIGHCPKENVLAVRYANGKLYHYADVPRDVYDDLLEAESIGSFLAKNVRDQFKHTAIDEPQADSAA